MNTASGFDEGKRPRKKRKKGKKSEKDDVGAAKVANIQDELDHQTRVQEMAMEFSSS